MDYQQWEKQNANIILDRWCDWSNYAILYRNNLPKDFTIPVPSSFFEAYQNDVNHKTETCAIVANKLMLQQYASGKPYNIPNPVPSPPTNRSTRAYAIGAASDTAAQAAYRGAKDAMKQEAKRQTLGFFFRLFK
jgi:hypothetical protein